MFKNQAKLSSAVCLEDSIPKMLKLDIVCKCKCRYAMNPVTENVLCILL